MRIALILVCALIQSFPLLGRDQLRSELPDAEKANTLKVVCGRLQAIAVRDNGGGILSASQSRRLPGKKLQLFKREASRPCCEAPSRVEELTTNRQGRFEFKTRAPGHYWLLFNTPERQFDMPLIIDEHARLGPCSDLQFDAWSNGEFWLMTTIHLFK